MRMERTVREIAGDYAVLENETGGTTEVALALLPDGRAGRGSGRYCRGHGADF